MNGSADRYPDRRIKCRSCGAYDERWTVDRDGTVWCLDCGERR